MTIALVTGAAGLVGAAAVKHFAERGMDVVGIDNDMRKSFFGEAASTAWIRDLLLSTVPRYRHEDIDIRDKDRIDSLFADFGAEIVVLSIPPHNPRTTGRRTTLLRTLRLMPTGRSSCSRLSERTVRTRSSST